VTGFLHLLVISVIVFLQWDLCPLFLKRPQEDSDKCRKVTVSGKQKMFHQHKTSATNMKIVLFPLRPTKIINKKFIAVVQIICRYSLWTKEQHLMWRPHLSVLLWPMTKPFVGFSWNLVQELCSKSCRISRSCMKLCTVEYILYLKV
jgi:hypothetical protein